MSCSVCGDKGVLKVGFEDGSPTHYAVCLCASGQWYRSDLNAGKHTGSYGWELWAARYQVPPDQMRALEDLYDATELAQMGFAAGGNGQSATSREALLLEAGKTRKGKL